MVNFARVACALAVASLASSQSLTSTKASTSASVASRGSGVAEESGVSVPSGVVAPIGAVPSGQTAAPSTAPPDLLPSLSLLGSKREAQQSPPPQVESSVGSPLSGPLPTETALPPPLGDVASVTRRATGFARRQQPSGSPPPKPSSFLLGDLM
jgi:hypothetical protein